MTKPQFDDLEAVRKVIDALAGFEPADQERILRWTREKVGLAIESQPASSSAARSPAGLPETPTTPSARIGTDIKSFFEAKNPASDMQFAATVAYYYRFEAPEQVRKESITAADLQEACRLVGRSRLRVPAQTLINALRQGLLDRGERGAYTINTVGENLVAMALPTATGHVIPKRPRKKSPAKPRMTPTKRVKKASG